MKNRSKRPEGEKPITVVVVVVKNENELMDIFQTKAAQAQEGVDGVTNAVSTLFSAFGFDWGAKGICKSKVLSWSEWQKDGDHQGFQVSISTS
jgi:hypothetical protein